MLYNSVEFGVMFVLTLVIYYIIPKKQQWKYLLVVSYLYYFAFSFKYTLLLFGVTVITYYIAIRLENYTSIDKRKCCLIIGVVLNVFLLSIFKYSQWIYTTVINLGNKFFSQNNVSTFNIIIPVGISFYTFRIISYLMDVYQGKIKPEKI